jgi:hypothetical protein
MASIVYLIVYLKGLFVKGYFMPTGNAGIKFFERLAVLETKVKDLMIWQRWQMGLLAAILLLAVKNWVR